MITGWKGSRSIPVTIGADPHVQLCHAQNDDNGFGSNVRRAQRRTADMSELTGIVWCAIELSDGKILTTMEWLMVFAKVPL